MIISKLYKIKPGKLKEFKDWCFKFNGVYKEEATGTLQEEGLDREFFILFNIDGIDYVLASGDTPTGIISKANLDKELNNLHRQVMRECLESITGRTETLYDLLSNKK